MCLTIWLNSEKNERTGKTTVTTCATYSGKGNAQAHEIARQTMTEVREVVGV